MFPSVSSDEYNTHAFLSTQKHNHVVKRFAELDAVNVSAHGGVFC